MLFKILFIIRPYYVYKLLREEARSLKNIRTHKSLNITTNFGNDHFHVNFCEAEQIRLTHSCVIHSMPET